MSSIKLIRWGGLAAIVAGIWRGVSAFAPNVAAGAAIVRLYLATDIFLFFGIIGLYPTFRRLLKSLGANNSGKLGGQGVG